MRTGLYISGAAHGGLILWLLVGGTIFRSQPPQPPTATDVSLISAAEYDALVSSAPQAPEDADSQPQAPGAPAESTPPPSRPSQSDPAPQPAPTPEALAEATAETPPPEAPPAPAAPAEVADAPPDAPDAPDRDPVGATLVAPPKAGSAPRPAQRIAPTPAAPPPPGAREDPLRQAATEPDTAPTVEQPVEQQEATAPKEAAAQTVTEADATSEDTVVAAAPTRSDRPKARPNRPAPTPAPQETVKVEQPKPAPADVATAAPDDAAVEAAIAAAMGSMSDSRNSAKTPDATLPVGPPLTAGEKDGLRFAVSQCWNLGSSSTEARRTEVTVAVTMEESGRPNPGSIRMIGFQGGTEAGAKVAFDAARRAILRCGAKGFDLPPEKYAQWREVEMTFNPDSMRIR